LSSQFDLKLIAGFVIAALIACVPIVSTVIRIASADENRKAPYPMSI